MRARLILALAIAATLVGGTATAADHGAPKGAADGQYVDISPVGLPIVYERRLINYVFVSVRLNLTGGANAMTMREKEPYFRDALVKLAHRRPFTRLDDFTVIDEAALRTAMGAEAARIAGPRQIANVQITSQAPQKRAGLPKPPQARTPARPAAAPH
jgi:hypothetical protein